jgi:hypothetical protein
MAQKPRKWRMALSLDKLLAEINSFAPKRSKASDGGIGDAAHASRNSDHNPWHVVDGVGVVTARDFTHDPAGGLDCDVLADKLIRSADPRIKYIIWNRRIVSGTGQKQAAWKWRRYTGKNGHTKHLHISVKPENCDEKTGWAIDDRLPKIALEPAFEPLPPLIVTKAIITRVQNRLKGLGYTEVGTVDGSKGKLTDTAILAFRAEHKLPLSTDIDDVLLDALAQARPRQLAPEREHATPATVAEKVPEAKSNWWTRFWAKWSTTGTVASGVVGGVAKALEYTDEAKGYLDPVREFLPNLSTVALLLLFGVVTFIIWRQATKTSKAQVEAFQTGARR